MLNEEKQGERRSLSELMGKSAALDEQLSPQLKELLMAYSEGLIAGARSGIATSPPESTTSSASCGTMA